MCLAYGVGLTMIYLLVVAQFKSYGVPLIIMAPIPVVYYAQHYADTERPC